jgi:hypothetical protein
MATSSTEASEQYETLPAHRRRAATHRLVSGKAPQIEMRFRLYRDRANHHDHDVFASHHQPPTAGAGVALLFFFVLLVLAVRIALWWKAAYPCLFEIAYTCF